MARQWFNTRWNDARRNDIEFVECGNPACNNNLIKVVDYVCQGVREGTPPERVHLVRNSRLQDVTIICSRCGHFTVFRA